MSQNGYFLFTRNSVMEQLNISPEKAEKENYDKETIWVRLPQLDDIGDNMSNNC